MCTDKSVYMHACYHTNQRYKPESLYPRSGYSSDVCQLTSEDMAGSSCGVARDQRLREKYGDEAKSQDSHHKLYRIGVRCTCMRRYR